MKALKIFERNFFVIKYFNSPTPPLFRAQLCSNENEEAFLNLKYISTKHATHHPDSDTGVKFSLSSAYAWPYDRSSDHSMKNSKTWFWNMTLVLAERGTYKNSITIQVSHLRWNYTHTLRHSHTNTDMLNTITKTPALLLGYNTV